MAFFDLPLAELRTYRPELDEPADLDAFWAGTLGETRAHDLALTLEPVDHGLCLVDTYDVTFAGFGGHPIRAWLTTPAGTAEAAVPLPAVVELIGYGGGRGFPHERLAWAAAGYAYLVMDTRGQGSTWGGGGHTPDPVGSGPAGPGVMTRGILDPAGHYLRRLMTDAVRAVDAVRAMPFVDAARVAVTGTSQGGGLALAVAGLADGLVAVMPDVPFLCHYRRAVEITDADPYHEITAYLAVHRYHEAVAFSTLSYFDAVHLARRATAPTLFSVAQMDPVCPPSTVFAAFNWYGEAAGVSAKEIEVYPFNQHEGGQGFQLQRQIGWLARRLRSLDADAAAETGYVPPATAALTRP